MINGKKIISIMNLPGNSYTIFTFLNLMYVIGGISKKKGEKILFVDLDLSKAELSRCFKVPNISKLLKLIDKYKAEFVFDKSELYDNIVSNPVSHSGIVLEGIDLFLISGNIPRIAGFMKFDTQFVNHMMEAFAERYDKIYIFTSPDKESKVDKMIFKNSDKIISSVANEQSVFENTISVVENFNVEFKRFVLFLYMLPRNKTFFETLKEKFIPAKEISCDEFLDKLSYYLFRKKLTDEEKSRVFLHMKINEKMMEAEQKKDILFNKNLYLNDEERNTYMKYMIEFIESMFE